MKGAVVFSLLFVTFQLSLLVQSELVIDSGEKRVAIIGAGIGGASLAHFLREMLGEELEISIFERAKYVGGRIRDITIHGKNVELGASIYHLLNELIHNFANDFKFNFKNFSDDDFAIWNGKEVVFRSSHNQYLTIFKMLFRYFLSPYYSKTKSDQVAAKFCEVYRYLNAGHVFISLHHLVKELHLEHEIRTPFHEMMIKENSAWGMETFVNEIGAAVTRCNYNQDVDVLHGLAGFVSLIAEGPDLRAIQGGNKQIPEKLIEKSGSYLKLKTKVKKIQKIEIITTHPEGTGQNEDEDGKKKKESGAQYQVEYETNGVTSSEIFDLVILATPVETSGIEFENIPVMEEKRYFSREFRITHVTMVVGVPNQESLSGLGEDFPAHVFTTKGEGLFSSFSAISDYINNTHYRVYKLFSRKELTDDDLTFLFKERIHVYRHAWHAYPVLKPMPILPPILLDKNLYYNNAFESVISVMEGSIISAKNIAKLISFQLSGSG